ncbi:MAG: S-layer homology domain-containing protein, partial [Clostridiaceae bacterium]|nr:S-layer homology domain-containing protein [Clostridiaceae bacterium]
MKNLRKVFAVVITLSMILSTVAFAAVFSDVTDSAAYAEAIELGAALNMFTGYEDGSFKPDGDITRAEFAAIIVRMLGQEAQSSGAAGATKFADVPSTHWAAGYINIVTNLGIVNGYGDGNYGPEDNVTYEQAVKMCVVALGYEPAAGGNYPVGYLTIAQQRGVTTNVRGTSGVAINRGQVAQMAFNSLDVPLMTQTGFGTYIEYVVNDGTGNTTRKTLLSENLDIVKVKAMVEKTFDLSSSKKDSLVQVEVINAYRSIYGEANEKFEEGRSISIDAGKTNLKSFVGYNVIAYISYNEASDDDPVALYVRKDIAAADEITIAASDIEEVVSKSTPNHFEISYMASKDARAPERITVDAN